MQKVALGPSERGRRHPSLGSRLVLLVQEYMQKSTPDSQPSADPSWDRSSDDRPKRQREAAHPWQVSIEGQCHYLYLSHSCLCCCHHCRCLCQPAAAAAIVPGASPGHVAHPQLRYRSPCHRRSPPTPRSRAAAAPWPPSRGTLIVSGWVAAGWLAGVSPLCLSSLACVSITSASAIQGPGCYY